MIRFATAAEVRPLRLAVLRPGGDAASVIWDGDGAARHLVLQPPAGGPPSGCVSVLPSGQLRGMAVATGQRGRGQGRLLLRAAEQIGARWCNARLTAVGFYAEGGWLVVGATYVDAQTGLAHVRMRRARRRRGLH